MTSSPLSPSHVSPLVPEETPSKNALSTTTRDSIMMAVVRRKKQGPRGDAARIHERSVCTCVVACVV
jgi:hypothetical protein